MKIKVEPFVDSQPISASKRSRVTMDTNSSNSAIGEYRYLLDDWIGLGYEIAIKF